MLGPPVCLPCFRIMDGYYRGEEVEGHKHWRCDKCGNDATKLALTKSLFEFSEKNIKKIVGEDKELLEILDRLKEGNSGRS